MSPGRFRIPLSRAARPRWHIGRAGISHAVPGATGAADQVFRKKIMQTTVPDVKMAVVNFCMLVLFSLEMQRELGIVAIACKCHTTLVSLAGLSGPGLASETNTT